MLPSSSSNKNALLGHLQALLAGTAIAALGLRLAFAVWRYSVNMLFWDQWDFYNPFFLHAPIWQVFIWQHGPHREGLGLVLDKFVLESTSWSNRAEALFMVGTLIAAAVVAIEIKRKLFGRLHYGDVVIPCLFLTFAQMEALVGTPNPSYSVVPELLIGIYCLAWLLPKGWTRYSFILVVNFLLIFTGFGLFMGAVTLGLLVLDVKRAWSTRSEPLGRPLVTLGLAVASFASFFYHYRPYPAISCFVFPDPHPLNYPWFVSLMFSYFVGFRAVVFASIFGGALAVIAVVLLLWHGIRLWRSPQWDGVDLTIVILLGFSLLFAVNTAIGRVCVGLPDAAQFSRYMGFLVPAFLAIYFHLRTWRAGIFRTAALTLFILALLPGTLRMPNGYSPQLVADGKRAWANCIRQTGDIGYCDSATRFPVYPFPVDTRMLEKLQFMQRNHLNLYSDQR